MKNFFTRFTMEDKLGRFEACRRHIQEFASCLLLLLSASALAQGTIDCANLGVGLSAKVTDTDGVTGLVGSAWDADLFWAPGTISDSSLLTALNQPATFSTIPAEAGFFFGGTRTIPTLPHVPITIQVRVWDVASGSSWAAAVLNTGARVGESILFQASLADPYAAGSPEVPVRMTGLNGHPWSIQLVPEPCSSNPAAISVAALFFRHRHRRAKFKACQFQCRARKTANVNLHLFQSEMRKRVFNPGSIFLVWFITGLSHGWAEEYLQQSWEPMG